MKKLLLLLLALTPLLSFSQQIIADDIDKFWNAYDKIVVEKDSLKQLDLIKTLYIDKATPGLGGIMKARRYTAEEFVYAINQYPKFWNSVRNNTLKSKEFSKEINEGVAKLKDIYPDLKPVNTYFEIGVLRTGGTTQDGMLLIGSEVALTDKSVVTEEIDKKYPHLRSYFDTEPIKDVVFLNVHEYIHTQQKTTIGNSLLAQTVMEGVAEFLAGISLNVKSPNPQIEFGYQNEEKIKQEYVKEMFSSNIYNWLMNSPDNQFKMRDLGYFVGYAICKRYYDLAQDKKQAVKEMINLDYNNEEALISFVEKTNYFDKPLSFYKAEFEKRIPTVVAISPFKNGSKKVKSGKTQITITFSQPLNGRNSGIDFGPLGADYFPKLSPNRVWSEDKKSITLEADLEPNKHYQFVVDKTFRNNEGIRIKPYLVEFTTKK